MPRSLPAKTSLAPPGRFRTLLFGLILFTVMPLPSLWACSCVPGSDNLEMQIHEANEILKARVTRVVRGESDVSAAVLIEERYKGKASKKEKIWTDAEESLCGYSFREGHTYLIFAKRLKSKKRLTTHLCSGTRPWDRVDAATLETLNDLRR